ncbi:MAG: phage holin family protein [Parcubacteria group bacterium]|nr:phage holin family protein [Parcubacteria group bacterium]
MALLINWLIDAVLIFTVAYLFPAIGLDTFWIALIAAVVIGLLNSLLRPLLILLTLPINILTLGLFTLVINAGIIMLADYLIAGFSVASFWWALLLTLLLSLANGLIGQYRK